MRSAGTEDNVDKIDEMERSHQEDKSLSHRTRSIEYHVVDRLYFLSPFLPRDASAERGNATVSRLSVRLSVRP